MTSVYYLGRENISISNYIFVFIRFFPCNSFWDENPISVFSCFHQKFDLIFLWTESGKSNQSVLKEFVLFGKLYWKRWISAKYSLSLLMQRINVINMSISFQHVISYERQLLIGVLFKIVSFANCDQQHSHKADPTICSLRNSKMAAAKLCQWCRLHLNPQEEPAPCLG